MSFEVGEGFEPNETRGRQAGSQNKDRERRDLAVAEARKLIASGMPKIEAAEAVIRKYRLGVQAEYVARLAGRRTSP
jgi:hypothetical protein